MMNYVLIAIFLCLHGVSFSSNSDPEKVYKIDQIITNYKNTLEGFGNARGLQDKLRFIKEKVEEDVLKSALLDITLFVCLKKFPDTFIKGFTKSAKEFTLDTIFYNDVVDSVVLKSIKVIPNNVCIVKYVSKKNGEDIDEDINNVFVGAKRFIDMPVLELYDCAKNTSESVSAYRKSYNNELMWYAIDGNDDAINSNEQHEDQSDLNAIHDGQHDEDPCFLMNLFEGSIAEVHTDLITLEDIMGNITCNFYDEKLHFVQDEKVKHAFRVIPQADGRYVRRTKEGKIKYFFVESELEQQETQLLLLKKSRLLISAVPTLQIEVDNQSYGFMSFFKKYGICSIRESDDKNVLYIRSLLDVPYHQFNVTRTREKGDMFKRYNIIEYCGTYQGIVSPVAKIYPFSNWLKLRFTQANDFVSPGSLELLYDNESVPFPLDGVIDIASAKCSSDRNDVVQGTNTLFKTHDNKWYHISTNDFIESLMNDEKNITFELFAAVKTIARDG